MTNLVTHPELKNLLPPLSKKEYAGLEKDILENGCLSPIVVWKDTIVDGHNRYEICQKHGISFEVRQMEFETLDDARFWAWQHQDHRRNLTPYQRTEIALQFKPMLASKAKEKESTRKSTLQNSAKSDKEYNTRQELADIANVSRDTVSRVEFLDKHADEETKENLRQGKTTINREYKQAKEKAAKPKTTKTKKTSKESPVAEPQREPENSEPSPSKNVPCIEELTSDVRTTLKGIRQNHPDHLLINLNMHFRDGYIEELVIEAMAFLHEIKGEKVTTSLAKEIAKRYIKTKR
ncbi:MAG: hypothetical protein FWC50_15515 [Planctomycetaceae bacterium]|nr:hypothetical protein [Planctomycetaceae bacterium]